ncbi:MAG: Na+/H+ antiporter subunit E [Anaerolineae bacterium]|jgi:multicomponent Na+:H+ antiporter subunit E|nr:Na+/H+ antiporter subunit E [Anaerolineae bacterium]
MRNRLSGFRLFYVSPRHLAQYFFFALLIGVLWVVLTNQFNLFAFGLGASIGFMLIWSQRGNQGLSVNLLTLPRQLVWWVLYALVLLRDILVSGFDVALRILGLRPIKSGILKVPVGDKRPSVTALTAHGITITPGQLVVDFDQDENVYVHCLDVEASEASIHADQQKRLRFYREMLGK